MPHSSGNNSKTISERGLCFYCLRPFPIRGRVLDHVVPQARGGSNSYRNLVSCCVECNSQKGESGAEDFLRTLYRQRRITSAELESRLRAQEARESQHEQTDEQTDEETRACPSSQSSPAARRASL